MLHLLIIVLLMPASFGRFLCGRGSFQSGRDQGTCYKLHRPTTSYDDAVQTCKQKPGYNLGLPTNVIKYDERTRSLLLSTHTRGLHWAAAENRTTGCYQVDMVDRPPRKTFQSNCVFSRAIYFYCSYEGAYFSEEKLTYQKAKESCASLSLPMFAPETTEDWIRVRHFIPIYWNTSSRYSNQGRSNSIWVALISKTGILFWNRQMGKEKKVNPGEMPFKPDEPHDEVYSAAIQWNGISHHVTFMAEKEEAYFICGTLPDISQEARTSVLEKEKRTATEYLDVDRTTPKPTTGKTEEGAAAKVPFLKWEHVTLIVSILVFAAVVIVAIVYYKRKGKKTNSNSERPPDRPAGSRPPFTVRGHLTRPKTGTTTSNKKYIDAGDIATLPSETANGSVHLYASVREFEGIQSANEIGERVCTSSRTGLTRQHVFNESGQYEIPFNLSVMGYVALDATCEPNQQKTQNENPYVQQKRKPPEKA